MSTSLLTHATDLWRTRRAWVLSVAAQCGLPVVEYAIPNPLFPEAKEDASRTRQPRFWNITLRKGPPLNVIIEAVDGDAGITEHVGVE